MRGVSNRAKWCPRFQDLKISLGSQGFQFMDFKISMGFLWISGFLWDFNLWISRFLWDLWDFYGIISVFYGNNRYFNRNKYIAWDFGSRIQARFQHLRPRFQLVADPSCKCEHFSTNCFQFIQLRNFSCIRYTILGL